MHLIELPGHVINGDQCNCTGAQLAAVAELCVTAGKLAGCTWYAAGVEAIGPAQDRLEPYSTDAARLVGDTAQFIDFVQSYRQFIWGVFIAVIDPARPEIVARDIDVEGESVVQAPGSEVEIRAFDTTFIDVITRNDRIASALAGHFEV